MTTCEGGTAGHGEVLRPLGRAGPLWTGQGRAGPRCAGRGRRQRRGCGCGCGCPATVRRRHPGVSTALAWPRGGLANSVDVVPGVSPRSGTNVVDLPSDPAGCAAHSASTIPGTAHDLHDKVARCQPSHTSLIVSQEQPWGSRPSQGRQIIRFLAALACVKRRRRQQPRSRRRDTPGSCPMSQAYGTLALDRTEGRNFTSGARRPSSCPRPVWCGRRRTGVSSCG